MPKFSADENWGEITDCGGGEYEGDKIVTRPQTFCQPTTCNSTLDVAGKSTLNETEVIPSKITIGGLTFVPVRRTRTIGHDSNGKPITEVYWLLEAKG